MSLTQHQVEEIAREAARKAANEASLSKEEVQQVVTESVRQTLIQLGISGDDPIEMQKDMRHLREWRTSMENIHRRSLLAMIGIAITGAGAALWVGIKELLGK